MSAGYILKLDHFEGPLDLLLHLIKVNEIDIFNIDIFLLTNQYVEYLRLLKFDDLHHAGEFLTMAASLIEIKSRSLLPNEHEVRTDDEEDDPVKSLQDRLIEYEMFRAAAEHFAAMPQIGVDIQTNHEWKRLEPLYDDIEAPLKGDASSMVILYEQLLKTIPERKAVRVEAKRHMVSIDEKIKELSDLLERLNFALFQGFFKKFASRYELVVYIMAILEMARWHRLKIYQRTALGPIWIYRPDFDIANLPLTREEKERLLTNASDLPEKGSAQTMEP